MKNLRHVGCFVLTFVASPLFAQESTRWVEPPAERLSFTGIVESTEFQTIVLLLFALFAVICMLYVVGSMGLGMENGKKETAHRQRGAARRLVMPGADARRVPLNLERDASVLRAARQQNSMKSPERENDPPPERG